VIINRYVLVMALVTVVSAVDAKMKKYHVGDENHRVYTAGNTVDPRIDEGDACYYVRYKKESISVVCPNRTFKNVIAKESSLTGTPGHIQNPKNYIGYAITKPSKPDLMGSGKKLNFWAQEQK